MKRIQIAVGALTALLAVAGCSDPHPKQQPERLRKAAGVTAFRIRCTKDLWDRTGGHKDSFGDNFRAPVKAQVTDQGNGVIVVQLNGPQLVDLLKKLDYKAHRFDGQGDPLAQRMYDAIAPTVDTIQATPAAGAQPPQVVIDDAVINAPAAPSTSSKPK